MWLQGNIIFCAFQLLPRRLNLGTTPWKYHFIKRNTNDQVMYRMLVEAQLLRIRTNMLLHEFTQQRLFTNTVYSTKNGSKKRRYFWATSLVAALSWNVCWPFSVTITSCPRFRTAYLRRMCPEAVRDVQGLFFSFLLAMCATTTTKSIRKRTRPAEAVLNCEE